MFATIPDVLPLAQFRPAVRENGRVPRKIIDIIIFQPLSLVLTAALRELFKFPANLTQDLTTRSMGTVSPCSQLYTAKVTKTKVATALKLES